MRNNIHTPHMLRFQAVYNLRTRRNCRSLTLSDLDLKSIDIADCSIRELRKLSQQVLADPVSDPTSIALVGDITLDPLSDILPAYCAKHGQIQAQIAQGDIGQYMQDVLNPASAIRAADPQVIFLFLTLSSLSRPLTSHFATLSKDDIDQEIQSVIKHVKEWVEVALAQTSATLFIPTFVPPYGSQLGIADRSINQGFGEYQAYRQLNADIISLAAEYNRVFVTDLDMVAGNIGRANALSPKLYHLAKIPWTNDMQKAVSLEVARLLRALSAKVAKCLVVDFDNTLWGGVIGEDGIDGIRISRGDATGEAFIAFQERIKQIKQRGIVLAGCSKNNYGDVEELFKQRTDMPLTLDDFTVLKVNWQPKPENLKAIAQELNIGIDSLVFIDDSDFEVGAVRSMLPEVACYQVPPAAADMVTFLDAITDLERLEITKEDLEKTEQYKQNAARSQHLDSLQSMDDYLRSLDTKIVIENLNNAQLNRAHQLVHKTNQFNLTTRRHDLGFLEDVKTSSDWVTWTIDAKDRFGDLGVIALLLTELNSSERSARIDTFVMSCRALGRGIESAIMNQLKSHLLELGVDKLHAEFIETKKNAPAAEYLPEQGFNLCKQTEGNRFYTNDTLNDRNSAVGITVTPPLT